MAGIASAKSRGTRLGRPPALNQDQVNLAQDLRAQGKSFAQIARTLDVGRARSRGCCRSERSA
ncbi:helix-turn-helix domain-containing protein [Microbacterium sp.]|uniref:helix-turn-helix domain-containing protein n=1 Tax=Microbacterium sp. TaxID=51671 RepID=UPI00260D6439|nr:helix-turn-helix domain-containing protein [Microbacterium sp.]